MTRRLFAVATIFTAVACAASLPARADGPDYDGTVSYIKSRLSGGLTEERQCVFGAKTATGEHAGTFHAGALDIVPAVIKPSEVHFECRKGEQCVSLPNTQKSAALQFAVHDDAEGVAIAISRLVEMCGMAGH